MSEYVTVHYPTHTHDADIVTALLLDMDYEAAEEKDDEISVSIKEKLFDASMLEELMERYDVPYHIEKLAQQNWNEKWEQSFDPVRVEDFAVIRASFHEPIPGIEHEIIITPKMSFGTGHHATTYLMIQQMRSMDLEGKQVIDFGTGTGVLAILAGKLGATHVLAIDYDEWSINNTLENIAANGCNNIETLLANEMTGGAADIILANINLNVIVENLLNIKGCLKEGGYVLFSGLLQQDLPVIRQQLEHHGFAIQEVAERNGWISLLTSLMRYPQS